MKNRLFFRLLILAVVTVFTVTSCKDYDDDITRLDKGLTELKNSIPADKVQMIEGLTTDLAAVKGEVAAAKEKLATLEQNGATQAQLTAAKEELMSKLVKAEAYATFVKKMDDELKNLKADLAKASTKQEVEALSKIYATKTELKAQQTALEAALGLKVDDPKTAEQLKDQIAKIKANEDAIKDLNGVIKGNIPETSELLAAIKKGLDLDRKLSDLTQKDSELGQKIEDLQKKLGNIKVVDVINLSFNHLKSLVLYPELYVQGVEAIVFRPLILWKEEPFSPTDPEDGCPIDPPSVPCLGEIGDLVSLGEDKGSLRVITPTARVKYNVNPSSLSLAMIDKDNLDVTSHRATFRAGGVEDELGNPFSAKYVGLDKGKIVVDLTVNFAKFVEVYSVETFLTGGRTWGSEGLNGPVLALQVPHSAEALKQLPEGTESYVTSDYACTVIEAINKVDIAKKQEKSEYKKEHLLSDFLGYPEKQTDSDNNPLTHSAGFPAGKDNAKAQRDGVNNGTPADIRLILLEEGSEINLLDSIQGVASRYYDPLSLVTINPIDYGFTWKFDLLDGNDQPIKFELTENKTDQQKFIELLDGEKGRVKAKVYGDEAQGAAVDRTPIVRVRIMKDDCTVSQAFIKILIVKKAVNGPDVVDLGTYEAKTPSGCDDAKHTMTVEEVNRFIYNKLKMSKEEFVEVYGPWTDYEVEKQGDFRWIKDEAEGRTTYLPEWSISICDVNFCGKPEALVQSSVIIKAKKGGYPNLKLNYKATIKAPVIALTEADFNKTYWDANFTYVRHHSKKPVTGSVDPNTFTYTTNINAAFKTHANHLLKLDKEFMQYEYTFAPVDPDLGGAPENQIMKDASNGKVTVRISTDGKQLLAKMNKDVKVKVDGIVTTLYSKNTEQLIATIEDHTATSIEKDPANPEAGADMLTYAETALAKYLLNEGADFMWAKLQIKAVCPCGSVEVPVTVNGVNTFNVHFLRPINPNPTSANHFIDGVDFGKIGSVLDIEKLAGLLDWHGDKFADNANYMSFYDVKTITLAEGKVMWDANDKIEAIPSTLEVYKLTRDEVVALDAKNPAGQKLINGDKYNKGGVAYNNNNNVVNKDFYLYIPILIEYKFGTIISETVKVQVKKTNVSEEPKP